MEYYCYKCGSPLNEMGKCPQCDTTQSNANYQQTQTAYNVGAQQSQPVVNYQNKPSVFIETLKQVWKLICHFFSRNTLDAVSEQYKETLPIWAVIFAVPVLFVTVYSGFVFGKIFTFMDSLIPVDFAKLFSAFDIAFLFLIVAAISIAAQVFSVYFFSKIQKKPLTLNSSANLVAGAYIPIALCSIANLLFGIFFTGASSVISIFGSLAYIILLSAGLQKAHNQEKPYFWRVLAVYAAAYVVTVIASLIVIIPFVFIKSLFVLSAIGNTSSFIFNFS